MTLAATLAKFEVSLEAMAEAARRVAGAQRTLAAKRRAGWMRADITVFLDAVCGEGDAHLPRRIAEMEAIADVLDNLRLGRTYAEKGS